MTLSNAERQARFRSRKARAQTLESRINYNASGIGTIFSDVARSVREKRARKTKSNMKGIAIVAFVVILGIGVYFVVRKLKKLKDDARHSDYWS